MRVGSLRDLQLTASLDALRIADPPDRWRALGFSVGEDGTLMLGAVPLALGGTGSGITGWSLPEIDGLRHEPVPAPAGRGPDRHENGASGLDHVVIVTPDFDRTAAAFAASELEFRRVRESAGGRRQGFRRCGPAIVEVAEAPDVPPGPARFWGLVPMVDDLDALCVHLGSQLISAPKPAVQPGRRIATLRRAAGLGCAVAFMTAPLS